MRITLSKELSGRILDIGGGGEAIIGRLYQSQVTAIDKYQQELDEAPGGFEKLRMDAVKLEFPGGSFDHTTFFYTLMYMGTDEQRNAIREAVRVLKPGGDLLIWDCGIPSAYPEPFFAEIDIDLPEEHIHTTHGIVKMDSQSLDSIMEICSGVGLERIRAEAENGHFFLHLMKNAESHH